MAKIQELIPSEAWSMLMVDEEKQELTFELALGEKGKDVSVLPGEDGGGDRGLGGADGPAHHRQRHLARTRASPGASTPRPSSRPAPCSARPSSPAAAPSGWCRSSTSAGGKFTQADLELLLTLVEPCAIAIENAILFQRTEQLTITDDLTKLFNSRYLNLYIGREIKRCKRHGIPLSRDLPGPRRLQGRQRRTTATWPARAP